MTRQIRLVLIVTSTLLITISGWLVFVASDTTPAIDETLSQTPPLINMMQGNSHRDFAPVVETRVFTFPADHGPHLDFQTEWWYVTGNLTDEEGAHYGYQFTIFRRALARETPPLDSDWAGNQVYLAHVGVTDVRANEYLVDEIYSRGVLGLAGAQAEPFAIWVEHWIAEGSTGVCEGCLNLHVKVNADEFSFDLALESVKPVVLQGERGLSRKSNASDSASYYYSLSRLKTTGKLTIREQTQPVSGDSWMDHEWFSSALNDDQIGWDWFSLQLDDQRELMLFQVRQREPAAAPFKYGILIDQAGQSQLLPANQITFKAMRIWQSQINQTEYPVHWQIEIPSHALLLDIEAMIDEQERGSSFRYWEGAVKVSGQEGKKELTGHGYLEMTGY